MIPAGKPPISLIALKFSTLFRQLQHHLWKSGETLASCGCRAIHPLTKSKRFFALIDKNSLLQQFIGALPKAGVGGHLIRR